jgi:alanyl aminopeptidase
MTSCFTAACGGSPPPPAAAPPPPAADPAPPAAVPPLAEPAPKLRLPSDTRPTAEAIELHIDPSKPRFSGVVDIAINLDQPRHTIWLHGKSFHVTKATASSASGAPLTGEWKEHDKHGTASVSLPSDLPAGPAKLHIEFDGAFGTSDAGLATLTANGDAYAFTQFESIDARAAFPCFDEPGFKIPFDTTLVVPKADQAISNTQEVGRTADGDWVRVHFAPTKPLPSYLVAFAVGPLDLVAVPDVPANAVRNHPLPLRGVTTKGRGKDIAYAIGHTGEIVSLLEQFFGIAYPYDKLDLIAVPAKRGAMENAGAITFNERALLFDAAKAPLNQVRGYANVVAHELAHQWTGDLVTAAWWNDIWLNEAFATWVAAKVSDRWDPKLGMAVQQIGNAQQVMNVDALASTRQIRQPIESTDDIEDAFDGITYQKGEAVLSMFEHWVGSDVFVRGLHDYLLAHKFANATADDFLSSESSVSGKDVKTPFHTFLDQPGLPFLETQVACQGAPVLKLKQSRYAPLGSSVDTNRTWQVPVCAKFATGKTMHEACTLLTGGEGELALGTACPDWVLPNADATGYYRFAQAPADLVALTKRGLAALGERDRIAYANSLRAAYARGTGSFQDLLAASRGLATDSHPQIAGTPMTFLGDARRWLHGTNGVAAVERYGRTLYQPIAGQLGWKASKADSADRISLRTSVLEFLAQNVRDPAVRAEAKKRGLAYLGTGDRVHPEAVVPNLLELALRVAGEDADKPLWERVHAQLLKTDDTELRGRLITFLANARRPEVAPMALTMMIDHSLRTTEGLSPLFAQMAEPETRDAAWTWLKAHVDEVLAAVAGGHRQNGVLFSGNTFCDDARVADYEQFFKPMLDKIENSSRTYAQVTERAHLCVALRRQQEASARTMFGVKAP